MEVKETIAKCETEVEALSQTDGNVPLVKRRRLTDLVVQDEAGEMEQLDGAQLADRKLFISGADYRPLSDHRWTS